MPAANRALGAYHRACRAGGTAGRRCPDRLARDHARGPCAGTGRSGNAAGGAAALDTAPVFCRRTSAQPRRRRRVGRRLLNVTVVREPQGPDAALGRRLLDHARRLVSGPAMATHPSLTCSVPKCQPLRWFCGSDRCKPSGASAGRERDVVPTSRPGHSRRRPEGRQDGQPFIRRGRTRRPTPAGARCRHIRCMAWLLGW